MSLRTSTSGRSMLSPKLYGKGHSTALCAGVGARRGDSKRALFYLVKAAPVVEEVYDKLTTWVITATNGSKPVLRAGSAGG